MKIKTTVEGSPDPLRILPQVLRSIELKVISGVRKSVASVKRHLVAMTVTRLVRRSGALHKEVRGADINVVSTGTRINGRLTISGMSANKRGQRVSQYLETHFGKGVKRISAKSGMLAIPIQGGPAWRGAAPTAAPKDMKGIMVRIGQVLYAGKGRSRDLVPTFVLRPSVTIPRRVNPQDAVDEAQMEILSHFQGLVGSVN